MQMTMRQTRLASRAYADWADWTVYKRGRPIGRIYEDRHAPPEMRWFWSITAMVHPRARVPTSGKEPSFEAAKARLWQNWEHSEGYR